MDSNYNPDKQHTLNTPVNISGTGLHTGINVDMTLKPASPGFGFQFQRIDLPGQPIVKADFDLVTDTSGTTLKKWSQSVHRGTRSGSIGGHGSRQLPGRIEWSGNSHHGWKF
jgi:UDP-3-O-[3-hydroxymyristoyl] N-acetylglucosamine deacetylase/3-hydroxyacyl-[acyl-carrier-protein] dehydratase